MKEVSVQVLVVGGGLAGSILAWKLMQQGISTSITFDPNIPSASRVAAGLINPVTGQRLVLQANAKELLASCSVFYQALEVHFHTSFFFEKPMLRYLRHDKEVMAWKKRQAHPDYDDYLEATDNPNVILQHHTAYLDTQALLRCLHDAFECRGMLRHATLHYDDIAYQPACIRWRNILTQRIIFCEGWRGQYNPWFQSLPFQPAKGEMLDLKTSSKRPEYIINHGRWLLATHDGRIRFGATYDSSASSWHESTTCHAKEVLLSDLKDMPTVLEDVEVIRQQAGVRPNTLDKQPFLGFCAEYPNIGILNGFGSKGSMTIPYYADVLVEHIQQQKTLPENVDIRRFGCV
ncbi:MAG: FAD-dependent oxidoreductase [Mariprofundaceae bacterium]|nr:FAD-dependent oxidoreductase [Mariprofundaceae bacterium]